MTQEQIRAWLGVLGLRAEGVRKNTWVLAKCPLASTRHEHGSDRSPSFGVKTESGESRVHCFSCNFSGSQMKLIRELKNLGHSFDFTKAVELIVLAEEGGELEWAPGDYEEMWHQADVLVEYPEAMVDAMDPAYNPLHPYLKSREVPNEVARHWDLRLDPYRQRVVFPIRDWDGVLRGLHGRAVNPNTKLKYLVYLCEGSHNSVVWLGEHLVDIEEPVLLVESVFDLLRAFEVYPNIITPRFAGVTAEQLHRIRGASRVVTIFDGDKAGGLARSAVSKKFGARASHVVLSDGTDAGDTDLEVLRYELSRYLDLD